MLLLVSIGYDAIHTDRSIDYTILPVSVISNALDEILGKPQDGVFIVTTTTVVDSVAIAAPHGRGRSPRAATTVVFVSVESRKRVLHGRRRRRERSLRGSSAPGSAKGIVIAIAVTVAVGVELWLLLVRLAVEFREGVLRVCPGLWRCSQVSERAAAVVVVVDAASSTTKVTGIVVDVAKIVVIVASSTKATGIVVGIAKVVVVVAVASSTKATRIAVGIAKVVVVIVTLVVSTKSILRPPSVSLLLVVVVSTKSILQFLFHRSHEIVVGVSLASKATVVVVAASSSKGVGGFWGEGRLKGGGLALSKSISGRTSAGASSAESIVVVVVVLSKIGIGVGRPTRYDAVSNDVAVARKGGGRSSASTALLSLERPRPLGRRLLLEGLLEASASE